VSFTKKTGSSAARGASRHSAEPSPAEKLYQRVKDLTAGGIPTDETAAGLIVELIDDAIKEFGSTNQDKKIELRIIKEQIQEILPPKTVDELRKRAEGHILKRTFPRNRIACNVVLLIVGSTAILFAAYEGIQKYRMAFKDYSRSESDAKPPSKTSANADAPEISEGMLQATDFNHQIADHMIQCETCHGGFPRKARPAIEHLSIPGHQACISCHLPPFLSLKFKIADPATGLKSVGMCFICHDENDMDKSTSPQVKYGERVPSTLKIP
jgi:hypothetical protein